MAFSNRLPISRVLTACFILLAIVGSSPAQITFKRPYAPLNSSIGTESERERSRLIGLLTYRKIDVRFDNAPIREALEELQRQIGERIIGRFSDDAAGHGIDPNTKVSAIFIASSGRFALEEVLNQCEGSCTWQLRNGFIEVGTKARLAALGAREVRVYHIRDLLFDPPKPPKSGPRRLKDENNKSPEYVAAQLFATTLEIVEPEAWEPPALHDDEPIVRRKTAPGPVPPLPPTLHHGTAQQRTKEWIDYHLDFKGPLVMRGKWATARIFREQLIVNAPDFIHRQIDGYPQPTAPPDLEVEGAKVEMPQPPPN